VSDGVVRAAVEAGDRTVEELGRTCGAGTDCGGCHGLLAELLPPDGRELIAAGADAHH
jgi:bacterioferritin-associated ferredoxin